MPRVSRLQVRVAIMLVLAVLGLAAVPGQEHEPAAADFTEPFFRKLAEVRQKRRTQVSAYFDAVRRLADGIVHDAVMMDAFQRLQGRNRVPSPDYDLSLDTHYVNRYGELFDILFVDRSGYVFHSLRRESDYHSNLFSSALAKTKLSRHLRSATEITFIDYELYPPSDELAAFFGVPVFAPTVDKGRKASGNLIGWFVLQCPLNKLNSILSDRRGLGRTGEVYCVNAEQRMVTQSRFRPEFTDLRLKVETLAVSAALASGAGQRVIRDYRGVRVLSSFEPFEVYGTKWAIIAEIDEQEAITEHYKQKTGFYHREIVRYLSRVEIKTHAPDSLERRAKRVDMNEFAKALPGTTLETSGVATCTAIVVVLPNRFGYLAHIGPSDRIYGKPDLGYNDCLGELLYRLRQHDLHPRDLPDLEFTIVAAHDGGFSAAIDRLLDIGIELAQIRFAYNAKADYANVILDTSHASVQIEWIDRAGMHTLSLGSDFDDLGNIVRRIARTVGQDKGRSSGR